MNFETLCIAPILLLLVNNCFIFDQLPNMTLCEPAHDTVCPIGKQENCTLTLTIYNNYIYTRLLLLVVLPVKLQCSNPLMIKKSYTE